MKYRRYMTERGEGIKCGVDEAQYTEVILTCKYDAWKDSMTGVQE